MSTLQTQWLCGAMIGFGALIAIGWFALSHIYARLGYPPTPEWAGSVGLADDLDTVFDKVKTAFGEGFELKRHDDENLILEKEFDEPSCTMTFQVWRGKGGSSNKLTVRCPHHKWLGWSSGTWRDR